MEFVELREEEIAQLDFACGNFLQSLEMYRRYQGIGRESYFVGVKKDDKIVAAGLMVAREWKFGRKIFRVPGGWLMNYDSFSSRATSLKPVAAPSPYPKYGSVRCSASPSISSKITSPSRDGVEILKFITERAKDFCRQRKGIALEIAPNIVAQSRDVHNQIVEGENNLAVKAELERLGYKYLGEYEQVKWTFVKELSKVEPEEMLMSFRTDHRQRIRRAEREGVRVRELAEDELGILKEIAAEAGERHGFKDPEMEYYRSMKKYFGEKVKFVVAELPAEKVGGKAGEYVPLAASMFVNDGREMIYLYSGSVRKLQKYGGAHLIQWQMLREAMEKGCTKYNFYGVYPVEGNGVYNFKLGFRGRVEELLGTFILPIGWIGKLYVARLREHEYGEVH